MTSGATLIATSAAMNATKSRPSRNIVRAMRVWSPRSARNRVVAMSAGDEPFLAEQVSDLGQPRIGGGQDEVRRHERVVGHGDAHLAHPAEQRGQSAAERALVVAVD